MWKGGVECGREGLSVEGVECGRRGGEYRRGGLSVEGRS